MAAVGSKYRAENQSAVPAAQKKAASGMQLLNDHRLA
jgi:hypothetical protein